jgi:hypothetical protein
MKIATLITESLSSIVFHVTGVRKAIDIIEQGVFKLSADFAKPSESKINKPMFYLSTTRSRYGAYHVDSEGYVSDFAVMFVLDGAKLNNTYKADAVDYWQMTSATGLPMKDEMEDRLFSKDRTIPALKYIKTVDLLVNNSSSYQGTRNDLMYFVNLCKRKGMVLRVFNNSKDFLLGRNPSPIGETIAPRQKTGGFTGYPEMHRRYKSSKPSELSQIIATHNHLIRGKLPPDNLSEFLTGSYGYKRDYYRPEVARRVASDMHNETSKPVMQEIAQVMRYYRATKVVDLLDRMLEKYLEVAGG